MRPERLVICGTRKPRLIWKPELHQRFVDAVEKLGGADRSTPKAVLRLIGDKDLTLLQVKSHLQKYRDANSDLRIHSVIKYLKHQKKMWSELKFKIVEQDKFLEKIMEQQDRLIESLQSSLSEVLIHPLDTDERPEAEGEISRSTEKQQVSMETACDESNLELVNFVESSLLNLPPLAELRGFPELWEA